MTSLNERRWGIDGAKGELRSDAAGGWKMWRCKELRLKKAETEQGLEEGLEGRGSSVYGETACEIIYRLIVHGVTGCCLSPSCLFAQGVG